MLKIYHNNRCSKSREAFTLLTERGLPFEVVYYLETPLDHATLQQLLQKLGYSARQLMRSKETEYLELGLNNTALTEHQLIDAMVKTPKLIERPIIEWDDRAIVARPIEKLLEIL